MTKTNRFMKFPTVGSLAVLRDSAVQPSTSKDSAKMSVNIPVALWPSMTTVLPELRLELEPVAPASFPCSG